jgi:hypothetical protein
VRRLSLTEAAPLSEKNIADLIAANETLFVNCGHPACNRSVQIDLAALAVRLGSDHGAMHDDLVRLFRCQRCADAGRDQRPVFFTCIPDYEAIQRRKNGVSV